MVVYIRIFLSLFIFFILLFPSCNQIFHFPLDTLPVRRIIYHSFHNILRPCTQINCSLILFLCFFFFRLLPCAFLPFTSAEKRCALTMITPCSSISCIVVSIHAMSKWMSRYLKLDRLHREACLCRIASAEMFAHWIHCNRRRIRCTEVWNGKTKTKKKTHTHFIVNTWWTSVSIGVLER